MYTGPEPAQTAPQEFTLQNGRTKLVLQTGDISNDITDAIVCPSNSQLVMAGGVAGALLKKGGQSIRDEATTWLQANGELPVGGACHTGAGTLNVKYLIHTAGPTWKGGADREEEILGQCIVSCIKKAEELHLNAISFPAISTGNLLFPKDKCAAVFMNQIVNYFQTNPRSIINKVNLTIFDQDTYHEFQKEYEKAKTLVGRNAAIQIQADGSAMRAGAQPDDPVMKAAVQGGKQKQKGGCCNLM
eukprot:TRINITY_DN2442_c0_g1_i4.p1 TRINITY_DN2442_c0_g1~~TRINITY_DN2442_c0_g1_i4.p1  ORF type:complete len:245 (+),score=77.28 TRINITY_DN2442_c0_g1_i4:79-813(+)